MLDQAFVLCFVPEVLGEVKKKNPLIHTVYNVYQDEVNTGKDTAVSIESRVKMLKAQYGFEVIHPPFSQITPDSIKICHDNGLSIGGWVWNETAEEELKEAIRLASAGIDEICTNQPEKVLAMLQPVL